MRFAADRAIEKPPRQVGLRGHHEIKNGGTWAKMTTDERNGANKLRDEGVKRVIGN